MMTPIASIAASALGGLAETAATNLAAKPRPASSDNASGASFGDVLKEYATTTVNSLKNGEAAALAGVDGKASTQHVVGAVMQAERDLQTAIALRDKAVAAWQEISRMAI